MNIIWANEAFKAWCEASDYIYHNFGFNAAERFQKNTEEWQDALTQSPHIGKVEPLLKNRAYIYRSIVISHQNKLIYYIESNTIIIVDFWDTRREPKSQADKLN